MKHNGHPREQESAELPGRISRWADALRSVLDPGSILHAIRLLHYYSYSHVRERRKLTIGPGSGLAPNLSIRHGERIMIGRHCHVGEHCYLWAGPASGRIILGDHVSLAPGVFITASDYRFREGIPFRQQPKRERDVRIGSDVWIGAGVVVTAGVTVGDGCIIGAGAVVTRDIPGGSVAVGVPATVVRTRSGEPAS